MSPRFQWKRILCPVDFSGPSREALAVAAELSRRFEAELTLFHAYELQGYVVPTGDFVLTPGMLVETEKVVDDLLAEMKREAERLGGLRVSTARSMGPPFAEIVRHARVGNFDLIVMGTHGRSAIRHALIGSVAEKVVRKAPCPVLTVRPPNQEFSLP